MNFSVIPVIFLGLTSLVPACAQTPAKAGPILSSESARGIYDSEWAFAEAYRAGDYIFVSGKILGASGGEPLGVEEFKEQARRVFQALDNALTAGGSGLDEVVMIRSYHVFDSELFTGSKMDQIMAFQAAKSELVPLPHPAQTSVGVSELIPDNGIVEVEVVAYSPQAGE